jgi:C-terminal processing protease CtpA/Prc
VPRDSDILNLTLPLLMKQAPGCTLIGDRTAGCSGNPKPTNLGNGVTVFVPSWKDLRLNGTCLEGEGFAPDIAVKAAPQDFEKADPVLELALRTLRGTK